MDYLHSDAEEAWEISRKRVELNIAILDSERKISDDYSKKESRLFRRLLPVCAAGLALFAGSQFAPDVYRSKFNPLRDSAVVHAAEQKYHDIRTSLEIAKSLQASSRTSYEMPYATEAIASELQHVKDHDSKRQSALERIITSLESEKQEVENIPEYKEYLRLNAKVDNASIVPHIAGFFTLLGSVLSHIVISGVYNRKRERAIKNLRASAYSAGKQTI